MFDNAAGTSIHDMKEIIKILWKNDRHPLLMGDRGIGKSQTAYQVATDPVEKGGMGLPVYYLNCSQIDAESLIYPAIKETHGVDANGNPLTGRSIDLITIDGLDKPIVVLLDEITNARPSLWSLLLSFVAEKRIGARHFPDILFIGTGNKSDHSSLAQPLPRPLMERFCLLDAPVPSKLEWMSYMQQSYPQVPSYYYGFVHNLPNNMFYAKEDTGGESEDYKQMPSPRSHTYASTTLSHLPTVNDAKHSLSYLFNIFEGYLGKEVASRFIAYVQDSSNFLTYEDFLKGKQPENPSQVINLVISATEKLLPLVEKGKQEEYYAAVDELVSAVHTGKVTSLTQFAVDTVTNTTPQDRSLKQDLVTWARHQTNSGLYKIIEERRVMLDKAGAEFEMAR